jgi:hypothetical protein
VKVEFWTSSVVFISIRLQRFGNSTFLRLQLKRKRTETLTVGTLTEVVSDLYRFNQPINQKKLTKGEVGRSRETSSLDRFDHSCIPNALLEMANGALNCNRWDLFTLMRRLSLRKALICQTMNYCYWWEIIPSGNLYH